MGVFSDELRQAVAASPYGPRALERLAGVPAPCTSRFVNGLRGLSLAYIDQLAEALDLHVIVGKPKGRKRRQGAGRGKPHK